MGVVHLKAFRTHTDTPLDTQCVRARIPRDSAPATPCFRGIDHIENDLLPAGHAATTRARRFVHCYPTLDRSGLQFSAVPGSGGLVAPVGFASMIGGIFPIALCGRSSL